MTRLLYQGYSHISLYLNYFPLAKKIQHTRYTFSISQQKQAQIKHFANRFCKLNNTIIASIMLSRTLIKFSLLSKLTDWLTLNFKNHDDIIFIYHVINVYNKAAMSTLLQCQIYHCAQVCLRTGPRSPGAPHLPAKIIFLR